MLNDDSTSPQNAITMTKSLIQRVLFIFTSAFISLSLHAQTATSLLDQTAAKLKNSGGISATFEATQFKKTTENGTTQGSIDLSGKKFKVTTPGLTTWFDGKTQWSMLGGSGEVNVSTPTAEELQSINPYAFVDLYKSGYKSTLSYVNKGGKKCPNVRLVATSKQRDIREMRIVLDPDTHLPSSIRILRKDGNWFRIRVKNISLGKKWDDSHFRFSEKDYPGVEIIDLR